MNLENKKVLLIGFAREGQATYRFIKQTYPTCGITICDKNIINLESEEIVYCGERYLEEASVKTYDCILRSPGVPQGSIKKIFADTPMYTAASLFLSHAPGTVIGVTGTKGKSTTSTIIAALLAAYYADVRLVGNIGKPALDYLHGANEKTYFVAELSSFQLEDVVVSPDIAVVLPIVPEHLDHHGTMEDYVKSKYNIFKFDKNKLLISVTQTLPFPVTGYKGRIVDPKTRVRWEDERLFLDNIETDVVSGALKLRGKGALENICYATTVALELGVSKEVITSCLPMIAPLAHRLEVIAIKNGITYVNDSLCTVPEALINALQTYQEKVSILIAGGHDRGITYDILEQVFLETNLEALILLKHAQQGSAQKIRAIAQKAKPALKIFDVTTMIEAVALANKYARKESIVLLSPASSSFGLFKDYADRGVQFKEAVIMK